VPVDVVAVVDVVVVVPELELEVIGAITQEFEIVLLSNVTSPVFAKAAPWTDVPVPSVTLE